MLKINDVAVDTNTGELVLVTNGIGGDADYKPCEGLVFVMEGQKMVTWGMQNIEARTFRKATDEERNNLMPQFEARCEEIRKGDRKRKK